MKDPYAVKMVNDLILLAIMIFSIEPSIAITEIVSALFADTMLAFQTSARADTYLGLLLMAAFWALFSGTVIVVSVYEVSRRAALAWVASYAASSLLAAYCFGRLL